MIILFVDEEDTKYDVVYNKHWQANIECSLISLKIALRALPYFFYSIDKERYLEFNLEILEIFQEPAKT